MCDSFRPDELFDLAYSAWREFEWVRSLEVATFPSIPVLYFGDSKRYWESSLRILTVGKNPSLNEFPEEEPYRRFPLATGMAESDELDSDRYLNSLDQYFDGEAANTSFGTLSNDQRFELVRHLLSKLDPGS